MLTGYFYRDIKHLRQILGSLTFNFVSEIRIPKHTNGKRVDHIFLSERKSIGFMREKLASFNLAQLRDIAKSAGLKGISALKKEELIDRLVALDEKMKAEKAAESAVKEAESASAPASDAEKAEAKEEKAGVKEAGLGAKEEKSGTVKRGAEKTRSAAGRKTSRKSAASEKEASTENVPAPAKSEEVTSSREDAESAKESTAENRDSEKKNENRDRRTRDNGEGRERRGRDNGEGRERRNQDNGEGRERRAQDNGEGRERRSQDNGEGRERRAQDNGEGRDRRMQDNRGEGTGQQEMRPTENKPPRQENVYTPQEGDEPADGIIEVMPEGYGFIRCDNYLPGENDVYVSPAQIRRYGLRTGDVLKGIKKAKSPTEKFSPLVFLDTVNGYPVQEAMKRVAFENMTPIFPNERIRMETDDSKNIAMRVMDLVSPVGKGQRGMIVSPPKAGKTTLLKSVAQSILFGNPNAHIIILLIDERPEEVTDMKEAIKGKNVEVIYSTFDEMPEHHARVSEMVIERARRLVEHKEDVVILLDSITRLARAYNQVIPPSGRTLSGGLDPAALHMPKRFFGAARNMREGGSLTILATALVETGSKMDDVVYEEFKGTGNMEMILDRKLSEKRIFPAVDLAKSGTRREDLLLTPNELRAMEIARRALNGLKSDDAADRLLDEFKNTRSNAELVRNINVRNHV